MVVALTAIWIMSSLAAWPFLSWDAFEERDRPLTGFITAVFLPPIVAAAPLFVAGLALACMIDGIPRNISKWWNSSWA